MPKKRAIPRGIDPEMTKQPIDESAMRTHCERPIEDFAVELVAEGIDSRARGEK
jgi:hypothetical protein